MGGQYGSEGKGSICSWLSKNNKYGLIIRISSPNSGHTFYANGIKYIMRQLPCTWTTQNTPIYLPSSSVINKDVLQHEIELIYRNNYTGKIYINKKASIITSDNINKEQSITTGSTYQGVGATRAAKCIRQSALIKDISQFANYIPIDYIGDLLDNNGKILIEASQGFGLSLNYKYYPYCTSQDIDPYNILGQSDIPFNIHTVNTWLILRTFPIRIAGNSGYLFKELTWQELRLRYGNHIQDEYTSVSNKIRRVGEFDYELAKDAIHKCNPTNIILTFFDYIFPNFDGIILTSPMYHYLKKLETKINHSIDYVGYGNSKIFNIKRAGNKCSQTNKSIN
jgi:adenylosuccinate synthase